MQQNLMNSNSNNNNSNHTKLLLEELANNSLRERRGEDGGEGGGRRKSKVMKKQSSRLAGYATRSSHLFDSFSEFLASRNVINQTSRYDILVSDNNNEHTSQQEMLFADQVIFPGTLSPPRTNQTQTQTNNCFNRAYLHQTNDRYLLNNQPITYKYYDCLNGKKTGRVKLLVSALFSRRQNNKTSLLLSLLRAPVVLAALFSLILVVTLMILYTMSFHHCYYNHHHHHHKSHEKQSNQIQELEQQHHINSRQLKMKQIVGERQIIEINESNEYSPPSLAMKIKNKNGESVSKNLLEGSQRDQSEGEANPESDFNSNSNEDESYRRALTVQTECGSFVGSPEGQAIVFKGIAYASPPIGRRRWTRPRPVWQDSELCNPNQTKLALHSRTHCAQLSPVTRRFSGHEDCLYLDIFTPKLNDQLKKLPVMVYVHGGFLTFGSSGHGQVNWLKGRPSAKLASELNVVLVSLNYRLQALGFITLVQLAHYGPDGSEGNYGLWDQLTALNWIKRNIESFAGDSNNIVLFGPDSASALPLALISNQFSQQLEEDVQEIDIKEEELKFKEDIGGRRKEFSGNLDGVERNKNEIGTDGGVNLKDQLKPFSQTFDRQQKQQQQQQQQVSLYSNRDLFRAVWLTNPTVYYELPYEMASKHYQRLFLKQSPCLHSLATSKAIKYNITVNHTLETNNKSPTIVEKAKTGEREDEHNKTGGKHSTPETKLLNHYLNQPFDEMLECLMNLSSEQVIRHYLGDDDPSYRLDDQNSLPIHGIFADQFVTVDRELVQDSYPFTRSSLDSSSTRRRGREDSLKAAVKPTRNDSIENGNLSSNKSYVVDTNKQETNENDLARKMRLFYGKDLLLGSTAQAVEYWPCPRNLDQWNWEEFERYVSTSLNSFSRETFKKATEMYNISPQQQQQLLTASNVSNEKPFNGLNPKEVYLTMVSDIRQICPINELADSMLNRHHTVHRYIVETSPSKQAIKNVSFNPTTTATTTTHKMQLSDDSDNVVDDDDDDQDPILLQYKPEFAYHTWDLFAFFGFEFDPDFVPQEKDIKFQSLIRQMVKKFVHRDRTQHSDSFSDSDHITQQTKTTTSNKFTLYTKNGTTLEVSKYKLEECKMWRKHIERSYAWVS